MSDQQAKPVSHVARLLRPVTSKSRISDPFTNKKLKLVWEVEWWSGVALTRAPLLPRFTSNKIIEDSRTTNRTIKASNFGPRRNLGLLQNKGLLTWKCVLQKIKNNISCRNALDVQIRFWSFLVHNSPYEPTELARKGPKFPWGPKFETFTVNEGTRTWSTFIVRLPRSSKDKEEGNVSRKFGRLTDVIGYRTPF